MSAGLQFMQACIDNGSRGTFLTADVALFDENEQRAYTFVRDFTIEHGGLPTTAVLRENGLRFPAATGPVDYHYRRLSDRAVYNSYATNQTALHEALRTRNMDGVREILGTMSATMASVAVEQSLFTLDESARQAWAEYLIARDTPGLQGMTYGWPVLDDLTGGLRGGDVATIVARPGLGKSFTVTRAAVRAWQGGASIAFVSMEMTAVETARRVMAMELGLNPDALLRGRLSDWAHSDAENYVENLGGRPPFHLLVGDLSKSVADVDALIMEHAPDFVCVDASYLLQPSPGNMHRGRRWEAVADVARELKSLALRRNKPILQTVQFNRTQTQDEEMSLDQIGGSDEIGQISALVLGMKRGPSPYERSRRRYVVLKNRHGPDHLTFQTNFTFEPFNMDEADDDDAPDDGADWNGERGEQPAHTEWSNV